VLGESHIIALVFGRTAKKNADMDASIGMKAAAQTSWILA